ncbi:MAG: SusE domain-containing protein [Bacteroidota bacterium]|nr:SusE domain-containing protein [Bacteroidota bacterium]
MKYLIKLGFFTLLLAGIFAACEKKVDPLPIYAPGTAAMLTASTNTIAPAMADSNKTVLTLNWTNPNYSVDSNTVKYIVEVDSSGRNFAKEVTKTVIGSRTASYTAKELNNILLAFGFAYNTAYNIDVRITSSQGNNNEQLKSNTVTIKFTTYVVPPKVTPPSSKTLFLVGSATAGGWGNPVPVPAQQFKMLDSVTYQGTFFLNGGQQYLLLPVNGDWTHKYSVQDNTVQGLSAGGSFGADLPQNFPGPAVTGFYKITVDFQHGTFVVASAGAYGLLYVPGDYQGWSPATASTLGAPKNDGNFEGYVNFPSGGTYQFKFTTTPDWSNALGDAGNGTLSTSGGNLSVPAAGYYKINANTVNNTWSATKTAWSLIGSFAASGWNNDVDMTYDAGSNSWSATITTATGDQFKFRANHDWGINLGESGGTGQLSYGGDNIGDPSKNFSVPAGTHKITLFLGNSGYYTYMIQ